MSPLNCVRMETDLSLGEALCQELLSGNAELAQRRSMLLRKKEKLAEFSLVLGRLRKSPSLQDEEFSYTHDEDSIMGMNPEFEESAQLDGFSRRCSVNVHPAAEAPSIPTVERTVEVGEI
jgi:hypothetical protein